LIGSRFGVIGASCGSGGLAVWLDTALAEQVAQAFELAEQSLVFGDYWTAVLVSRHLLFQPQLVSKQLPLPVAQRRGCIEVRGVERGFLAAPHPGELFCGVAEVSGQLRLRICLLALTAKHAQHLFPDQGVVGAEPDERPKSGCCRARAAQRPRWFVRM
jgi:hypothetical protein